MMRIWPLHTSPYVIFEDPTTLRRLIYCPKYVDSVCLSGVSTFSEIGFWGREDKFSVDTKSKIDHADLFSHTCGPTDFRRLIYCLLCLVCPSVWGVLPGFYLFPSLPIIQALFRLLLRSGEYWKMILALSENFPTLPTIKPPLLLRSGG